MYGYYAGLRGWVDPSGHESKTIYETPSGLNGRFYVRIDYEETAVNPLHAHVGRTKAEADSSKFYWNGSRFTPDVSKALFRDILKNTSSRNGIKNAIAKAKTSMLEKARQAAAQAGKKTKLPLIGGCVLGVVFFAEDAEAHGTGGAVARMTPILGDYLTGSDIAPQPFDVHFDEQNDWIAQTMNDHSSWRLDYEYQIVWTKRLKEMPCPNLDEVAINQAVEQYSKIVRYWGGPGSRRAVIDSDGNVNIVSDPVLSSIGSQRIEQAGKDLIKDIEDICNDK